MISIVQNTKEVLTFNIIYRPVKVAGVRLKVVNRNGSLGFCVSVAMAECMSGMTLIAAPKFELSALRANSHPNSYPTSLLSRIG